LPAAGTLSPTSINIINGVGQISAIYDKAEIIFLQMTDNTKLPPGLPTQSINASQNIEVLPGQVAEIDGDLTEMYATQSPQVTFVAKDRFGDLNPNQTLGFDVISIDPPGRMLLNGLDGHFSGKTNSVGEITITFSAPRAFGDVVVQIRDLSNPDNPFRKYLTIRVKGIPQIAAGELGFGQNRIPVGAKYFLPIGELKDRLARVGAYIRTYYSVDNGPFVLYDEKGGATGFDTTKQFNLRYYSEACYDAACSVPVSELDVNGSPNILQIMTYELAGKLTGYPSPFNPARDTYMTLQYPLAQAASIDIDIYDTWGHKVKHIAISDGAQGGEARQDNRVFWDGTNDAGIRVANGVYIVRVKAPGQNMNQKVAVRN
jgi:hypothetical protein